MSASPQRYDVIVGGARCAGSPTAMLLARKGYRVLLVDRVTFPADTMRNHFIHGPGIASLKRWELLDRIADSGCPAVRQMTFDFGDFPLTVPVEPVGGVDADYAPRRFVLDALLAQAAVEAGANLREGFSVHELVFENGEVVGIRGRSKGGAISEERTETVVGADGLHSLVARAARAPVYDTRPTLTCGYFSYFAGIPLDSMAMAIVDKRFMIAFPTHGGLTCVAVQAPVAEFPSFRSDVEGAFFAPIARSHWFEDLVRTGRRVERWLGTADLPNQYRKPYGPGWALVGDAGYHKDPLTAQGITDALRDAEVLSAAIDAGLSGRRPIADALGEYERRRNEATRRSYEEAVAMASFVPFPPELDTQRAALRRAA